MITTIKGRYENRVAPFGSGKSLFRETSNWVPGYNSYACASALRNEVYASLAMYAQNNTPVRGGGGALTDNWLMIFVRLARESLTLI